MKTKRDYAGKICVVVGTVTDDLRLYEVPPLKVRLFEFYKPASQRSMRAKGRAMRAMRVMRVMRALVKMLRFFICYIYMHMRTRTRATEQDE